MLQNSAVRKPREKTSGYRDLAKRPDGSQRRVLYAEDQASTRIVTEALLIRMGFEVESVEDGELAVEKARASAFDLILLDIEMPNMDGVTAARQIRSQAGPCQSTPIMAMSAFLADSTEHSVWRDAFDSALPKPANSNELRRALSHIIEGRIAENRIKPPIPRPTLELWAGLSGSLSSGTRRILAKTIMQELHHTILVIASCRDAEDKDAVLQGQAILKNLAMSFRIKQLEDILDHQDPTQPDVLPMLNAVAEWHHHMLSAV
jgi:CheY-like chemotaxis protein